MKKISRVILLSIVLCSISACNQKVQKTEKSADSFIQDTSHFDEKEYKDCIAIKYAKGLKVEYKEDGVHVTISNPSMKSKSKTEEFVINKKNNRFVCTTALQIGNFEVLGLEDKIVGTNSIKNLFSDKLKKQIKEGKTQTIGKEGNFDAEKVIALKPDFIIVSASKHGGYEVLKDCGIPILPHHGYKEPTPLGQAEWIKLIGLMTGEERRANAVFDEIETKYNKLKEEVAAKCVGKEKPTIASGRQLREGWYHVGGKSYMAKIFADAGTKYIMSDNNETGGETCDFEYAYAKNIDADYWQIDGSFDGEFSMEDLKKEDERYATLKAFKNNNVIFCNLKETPYRELAGVYPHIVLADFVKVIHPEILPNYTPTFYKRIK